MAGFFEWLAGLDQALLRAPRAVRIAAFVMAVTARPHVPRQIADFRGLPILGGLQRHDTYGNDTIGDGYEARVVLNDWRDMYTKTKVDMTPLESATWSKEACAPYPPAVLLAEAGLYALGTWLGIGFYGSMLKIGRASWRERV